VGQIVFDRYRGGPEGEYLGTFVLGTDGVEREIEFPMDAVERHVNVSPDGTALLTVSWSPSGGSRIGTVDLSSGSYSPITPQIHGDLDCSDWSPDGKAIICNLSSEQKTRDGIYLVRVAAGAVTRLTHSRYHDVTGIAGECGGGESRAVYSPDGTQFAYEQQKCGTGPDPSSDEEGAIIVARADGSAPHTVVPFGGVKTHPGGEISWSPAGDLIAFGTQESGELSVVHADGSGLRTIDLGVPGLAFGPAWSPDGKWLLVSVNNGVAIDLFAVAADGSATLRLTDAPDDEVYTDWGAAP
jgi:Tol biopolymer transport system component